MSSRERNREREIERKRKGLVEVIFKEKTFQSTLIGRRSSEGLRYRGDLMALYACFLRKPYKSLPAREYLKFIPS